MKRLIIPYRKDLKQTAKMLRKSMSYPEVRLWQELKGKKIEGFQFNRQRPINHYIVDFYCKDLRLAIEVDGDDHQLPRTREHDFNRQEVLESLGIKVMRFHNNEIVYDIETVISKIRNWIKEKSGT
jgi:very-short-patch-repair endonuclease